MRGFINIIKELNIDHYFRIVLLHNPSNGLPYHNIYHALCVMENCYFIGKDRGLDGSVIRKLCIASLFHDFGHSGGKLTDDLNIRNALLAVEKYVEPTEDVNEIKSIISATEYPYKDYKFDLLGSIIREADICQILRENYISTIFGLMEEMGYQQDKISEFIKGQRAFIENHIPETNRAAFLDRLDDVDYLVNLSNDKIIKQENEVKFLMSNYDFLSNYNFVEEDITQHFINEQTRYRKTKKYKGFEYNSIYQVINKIGDVTTVDTIDYKEYNDFLNENVLNPVKYVIKKRYSFIVDNIDYCLDLIYLKNTQKPLIILEIEKPSKIFNLNIPQIIKNDIIMEVTGVEEFSNYNLADVTLK